MTEHKLSEGIMQTFFFLTHNSDPLLAALRSSAYSALMKSSHVKSAGNFPAIEPAQQVRFRLLL